MYFTKRAEFGIQHGWSDTASPFNRKRFFAEWHPTSMKKETEAHIERQSKNTSIQGTGADGAKCALILIKQYIENHNLQDRVRALMTLHDAVATEAIESFSKEWAVILTELMIKGHNYNIPGRLIGADTSITDTWTK
jgi:DNA polymerase I-like protein with 3'-5' exonuclease and polymerase domains